MNISDYTLKLTYMAGEKPCLVTVDAADIKKGFENEAFSLRAELDGERLKIVLGAKSSVKLVLAELIYDHFYENDELFFANGFQSWTTSREYGRNDSQPGLNLLCKLPIARDYAGTCGDYFFTQYSRQLFHGFTYCYLRNSDRVELFGSLNERTGYTVFYADMKENVFAAVKDVEGVEAKGEYELFDIVRAQGTYDEVFDRYFALFPLKHTHRVDRLVGYTSWYNYYQNINEEIILRDLAALTAASDAANVFQIDDGFETKVGDWTVDAKKFPNGLKPIVAKIHASGLKAGLWLAPFAAQPSSEIAKKHPEWLVKKKNKPMMCGMGWGGFYSLDTELPEVRAYVKSIFDKVFNEWDFDMVKLDFLYCCAIAPRNGKSRGQLMCEAMEFLRECCGEKIILGCGVPLGPAFGYVDACRIGCDAESSFKDKYYVGLTNNEIISTRNAMNNAIFRRHLNGRILQNDPDVFFLRDGGARVAKYNQTQKELLAKINNMFGSVLFMSDNAADYDDVERALLKKTYEPFGGRVLNAEYVSSDTIRIEFTSDGVSHKLTFNTFSGEYTLE